MVTRFNARRGFTFIELLVVTVILVVAIGLLLPAINRAREAGRRASCLSNEKCIGLGIQNYASTFMRLPGSASLISTSGTNTVGGFSFLVSILPFMEYNNYFKPLNPTLADPTAVTSMAQDPATAAVLNARIAEYICPSNPNRVFSNPSAWGVSIQGALTNYKAIGATCQRSLQVVTTGGNGPYGNDPKLHPDGAIFPGKGITFREISDGTAHTVAVMETIDDQYSRWAVGAEVNMVGLPNASCPTGAMPTNPDYPYFAPPGYDGESEPASQFVPIELPSFLSYDFSPAGVKKTPPEGPNSWEDPGFYSSAAHSGKANYGPSSAHPNVINTLMVDGSVQSIAKQTKASAIFFMITRAGSDPFAL